MIDYLRKLPDVSENHKVASRRMMEPILWWCSACDIYFHRRRSWGERGHHIREHRPDGPAGVINGVTEVQWAKCDGHAMPVTRGPVLAAYLLGGMQAVYAMGKKVN